MKHIIFDFDGTLVNSMDLSVVIMNELATRYGIRNVTPEEWRQLRKLSIIERCRMLGIPFYKIVKLGKLGTEFSERYGAYIDKVHLFHGMEQIVKALKSAGHTLHIVSSNTVSNIRHVLDRYELTSAFDHIVSSKGLFNKAATLQKFMKKNGIPPERVVYIGDEVRDIEACGKAKLPVIAVNWGFDDTDLLQQAKPDTLVERPDDLVQAVTVSQ